MTTRSTPRTHRATPYTRYHRQPAWGKLPDSEETPLWLRATATTAVIGLFLLICLMP